MMIKWLTKSLFSVLTLIIVLACRPSFSLSDHYESYNYESNSLPLPENYVYGKEQFLIRPFKKVQDEALTCGQLIVSRGFKYERHFVKTKDEYILQLYRIVNPFARAARGTTKLKPVLLVHGSLVSCGSWMFNQPDGNIEPWLNGTPPNVTSSSLAFVLANNGYDVWLGNNRGTSYSLNHTRLNPETDPAFWDFSLVEMARYDVPAMVDYVIQKTGHSKITWIGYSQGTSIMFIHLSENPSLADKLDLNINISPVVFVGNVKGLIPLIANRLDRLLNKVFSIYSGSVPPLLPDVNAALTAICTVPILKKVCIEVYNDLFGPDTGMINEERFQVITSLLDSVSSKTLKHGLQIYRYKQIRQYDYGPTINSKLYGSSEPPRFPFQNIPTHNLVLITGLNDYLANPTDVQKLRNILKGKPLVDHVITYPEWSHTDEIFGTRAFQYSHSVIVKLLKRFLNKSQH